jgi:hypothetical protein
MRALPIAQQMCRGLRPLRACRHGPAAGGLQRLRGRAHPGPPSSILSPDLPGGGFEHPDKAGRWHAHAPVVPLPESGEVGPVR